MQINNRDINVLEHIIAYCEEIDSFIARFGDDYSLFCNDKAYKNACSLDILQIGELETHLSDEFKEKTSEIPWKDIKTMRNVVAHGYGQLDMDTTWKTIKEDIPVLKAFCKEKLKNMNTES